MANTIIGVYDEYSHAQGALDELLQSGFERSDVRLSPADQTLSAREAALRSNDLGSEESGGGWSIGNFFRALFGNDEHNHPHADVYKEALRRGSYLLTVEAEDEEGRDRAGNIMNRHHPVDIDTRSAHWQTQGWSRYDNSAPIFSDSQISEERKRYAGTMQTQQSAQKNPVNDGARHAPLQGEAKIPVVEEQLQVGKREVQHGGVRVFQRVTDKPVEEQVRLREEHVKVERHPVDQPARQANLNAFKEGSIEVRETAEEPVIGKTARVVEEVVVGKETRERTQTIKDTVRRTDVEVQRMGTQASANPANTSMDDSDFRTHWQTSYANMGGRYEDYAPAYRYGSIMAGSERYRGSRWNDVEPQVRSDWESNHAGHPWEKAKDAVRYGWEKITK